MVPRGSVSVAKASEHVNAAAFQNAVNAFDELGSVFDFHVVEAAHVKNKIKLEAHKSY